MHHPGLEQVFRQPGRSVDGAGFRRERKRQDRAAAAGGTELESHNQTNPDERVFVISYDDFNPYLDNCKAAMRAATMDEVLEKWRLEDHMDAILSLGVTKLVDLLISEKINLTVLSVDKRRDLLLLAALYDASMGGPIAGAGAGSPPIRLSTALDQARFADRFRDDIDRDRAHCRFSLVAQPQSFALALAADPGRMGVLGLAADPGGMVCP